MAQAVTPKLPILFRLVRLPNIFTAFADVFAGYMIAAWHEPVPSLVAFLLVASGALYGAGCVMNDLCDRDIDRRERPWRPIPSGSVSISQAQVLQRLLFAVGVSAAFLAGISSGITALVLSGFIFVYNRLAKDSPVLGPVAMGGCRATNLLLGMSVAFPLPADLRLLLPVAMWLYVASITTLSRGEAGEGREGSFGGFAAWGTAATAMVFYMISLGAFGAAPFVIAFLVVSGAGVIRALGAIKPREIQRGIVMMILGIPILDAMFAAMMQEWRAALPSLCCGAVAAGLSRFFHVT